MREQYGVDPEDIASLTPPARRPPPDASGDTSGTSAPTPSGAPSNRYLDLISSSYQRLAAAADKVHTESASPLPVPVSGPVSSTADEPPSDVSTSQTISSTHSSDVPVPTIKEEKEREKEEEKEAAVEDEIDLPVATLVTAVPLDDEDARLNTVHLQALNEAVIEAEKKEDIHMRDNFTYWSVLVAIFWFGCLLFDLCVAANKLVITSIITIFTIYFPNDRHWRELSVSPVYELTLLHWERRLQKDLGKSILNLLKFLTGYATEVFIILTALFTSLFLIIDGPT